MSALGGRHPAVATWKAGFDAGTGKVSSLTLSAQVDAGWNTDHGGKDCTNLNAYHIPGAQLSSHNVATPSPMNTIMRAPGHHEGALFTEAAIEAVAMSLPESLAAGASSMANALKVHEANMLPACLPVWQAMKNGAGVEEREKEVLAFNAANKWRKRGLYCMPVKYGIGTTGYQQKAIVSILADGSVQVDHSGIEMGQGINTKVAQAVAA